MMIDGTAGYKVEHAVRIKLPRDTQVRIKDRWSFGEGSMEVLVMANEWGSWGGLQYHTEELSCIQ